MTKTEKLCAAIRNRNDSEMRRWINEMTINEINARYEIFNIKDQNQRYTTDYFSGTALHFACLVNNTTAVEKLLGLEGIDVKAFGYGRWCGKDVQVSTPLMIAAAMKHMESFELLVQDERATVLLKADRVADLLKDLNLNQNDHDILKRLLDSVQKNYDAQKNRFERKIAATKEKLTVTVSKTDIQRTTDLEVLKVHENNYRNFLESKEMTDFRIICGEEIFHCHKNILFAQSNVLKTMFNTDMIESREDSMTITDLESSIVQLLIKFIYTGTVDLEETKRNSIKLLEVADRYELDGLTKLCENELMATIDNNNVLEMIMNADLYHADRLKQVAIKWIVANKFEIVKQDGWKEVLFKFPGLMTDMLEAFTTKPEVNEADTVIPSITEIDILKAHESNFEKLLESGEMSDFRIVTGEETFNCHKNILFAQSNVLGTMFNNDIGESLVDSITIADLEPEIVKLFIKFIYTGSIEMEKAKENATRLLEVADRYGLEGLTKLCENELMPTLDNNNVLEMIIKADLYHADKLRKYSMKWIVANKREIVKQKGWREVLHQFPILIDMLEILTKKS